MNFPNVVIAGAPKSGTTSIFKFLSDHPDVCASSIKETCFLMDVDSPLCNPGRNVATQGLKGYSQFFEHCMNNTPKIYLEATPDYLYQETPLKYLPKLNPAPQIIIILRKPAERIYSMFQFARNNMAVLDTDITFSNFVASLRDPNSALLKDKPHLRDAVVQSRYAHYIKRWLQIFGRDRIHVFLFEDLVRDPRGLMKTLCDKLGLEPEIYDKYGFEKQNVTRKVRIQFLQRIARRARKLGATGIPGGRFMGSLYRHLNAPPADSTLSIEEIHLIETLNDEFIDDNQRLVELLDIDISPWQCSK